MRLLPISFLMKMKQDNFPDMIKGLIHENADAFKESDLKEVEKAYNDFKENKIDSGEFERLAKKQVEIGIAILKGESHARNTKRGTQTLRYGFYQLREAIKKMRHYSYKIRSFFPPSVSGLKDPQVEHNHMTDLVNLEMFNDNLMKEVDACIRELKELRNEVEDRKGLFSQRLIQEGGIVKKEYVSNL